MPTPSRTFAASRRVRLQSKEWALDWSVREADKADAQRLALVGSATFWRHSPAPCTALRSSITAKKQTVPPLTRSISAVVLGLGLLRGSLVQLRLVLRFSLHRICLVP